MDANGCPTDYEELFTEYFPMMRGVVASSGIAPEDVEDVSMDLLLRFMEKEGIAYYDPDRLNDVGPNPRLDGPRFRKAKFKGMLRGFTATYVMQYRDKQMIRHKYFPYRLEAVARVDKDGTHTFADLTHEVSHELDDVEISVSIQSAIHRARRRMEAKDSDRRDYSSLIAMVVEQGLLDGKVNRKQIAASLCISEALVSTMIKEMREAMRPLLTEVGVVREADAA